VRALLCHRFGPPEGLTFGEAPDPQPGPGQVVVDVHACGVNFPDLLMIQDLYQFKPPLPFSPGGEVAGVVSEVGPDVDRVKVGDRVIAAPGWGGMAERVACNAADTQPVPDGMDFATASVLLYAYGTSLHALSDRAQLAPQETLLVLGAAGGVGLTAVELGKLLGARVIAAASSTAKLELARSYGADEVVDYTREDLRGRLKELTGGRGVDVVYDPVGGPYTEPALRSCSWRGRFLVVGFAAGDIPRIPVNLLLLKGSAMLGVFWGAFLRNEPEASASNNARLAQWWREGRIRPHISATYPLAQAAAALERLARREALGKLVVEPRA
jgi:NADPH2:quinone reductase